MAPDDVRSATLLGEDHPTLGEVAVSSLGEGIAIGLSAGRLPKSYWHLDPNEDAALAMAAGDAVLLAVADGHHGFDAARAAIAELRALGPDLLRTEPRHLEDTLDQALGEVEDRVAALIATLPDERRDSRTALSVALLRTDRAAAATYGDTTVLRVRGGKAKPLAGTSVFLGSAGAAPSAGSGRLKRGDCVVLCSDGITDFLGSRSSQRIAEIISARVEVEAAVRELLQRASDAGAGDHLAVAAAQVPAR
jgi:serine/threonine protein phosphatase PrpC